MPSSQDYLGFMLEQLSLLDDISYKRMMGEYILYYRGRIFGGIYDDRFLVKPVKAAAALMPGAEEELPYEGAKPMLLCDNVEDREFLAELVNAMYDELPGPKNNIRKRGSNMPRPTSKTDLLTLSEENFKKLMKTVDGMSEKAMTTPFDFSGDKSKKEAHWERDKNVRDVFIHLYEWHQLLIKWVNSNMGGSSITFLPAPYNWKTYGDMNRMFWEKHHDTSLADARAMLEESHREAMALAEKLSDEELFTRSYYKWTGNNALGSFFISNMSSHYDWALKKIKAHIKKAG